MLILALDTSTRAGSIALARGPAILAATSGDATRTHGERLPGDLTALVRDAGLTLADIDRFAVTIGPGAFTSLRVGIATVQALALVHDRRVVPVPTLDAVARRRPRSGIGGRRLVWMDGQRGEVFAALYDVGIDRDDIRPFARPRVGRPLDILEVWSGALADRPLDIVGTGIDAHRAALDAWFGPGLDLNPRIEPLAPTVARLALAPAYEPVAPHAVHPLYVRRPDAVLVRDRRRGGETGTS